MEDLIRNKINLIDNEFQVEASEMRKTLNDLYNAYKTDSDNSMTANEHYWKELTGEFDEMSNNASIKNYLNEKLKRAWLSVSISYNVATEKTKIDFEKIKIFDWLLSTINAVAKDQFAIDRTANVVGRQEFKILYFKFNRKMKSTEELIKFTEVTADEQFNNCDGIKKLSETIDVDHAILENLSRDNLKSALNFETEWLQFANEIESAYVVLKDEKVKLDKLLIDIEDEIQHSYLNKLEDTLNQLALNFETCFEESKQNYYD